MINKVYFSGVHEHYYEQLKHIFVERKKERNELFNLEESRASFFKGKVKRDFFWAVWFLVLAIICHKEPVIMVLDLIMSITHLLLIAFDMHLFKKYCGRLAGTITRDVFDSLLKTSLDEIEPDLVFELDNLEDLFPEVAPIKYLSSGDVTSIVKEDDSYFLKTSRGLCEFSPSIVRDNPDCVVCNCSGIILTRSDLVKISTDKVIETNIEFDIVSEEVKDD